MSRRIKEFVDIADHVSLDDLIARLAELRASLPDDADAELRLRGDDIFGHRITVSYMRDQTAEEAEIEARYAEAEKDAKARELERLQAELGVVCYAAPGKRGKLRIVACGGSGHAELQRQPVHAVAQAGRLRPVVEHVAEVPAAARAQHFGALHQQAAVCPLDDRFRQRPPETRPARPALELGRRVEQ
jgi:hypothetical protein